MSTNLDNYEIYGGTPSGVSLKGIVTLEKDENGVVGLEIPGLLSINNLEEDLEGVAEATQGDLFLHTENANVYSKQEEVEAEEGE